MQKATSYFSPWLTAALLLVAAFLPRQAHAQPALHLVDRLQRAEVGDYIVAACDNMYTVLIVKEKFDYQMSIEEITVPAARIQQQKFWWRGWKHWVETSAPGYTSWVVYTVHCSSGQIREFYCYNRNSWMFMAQADNFLSKLLTMRFVKVRPEDMKRTGPPPPLGAPEDRRQGWKPKVVFEGKVITDAKLEVWRTRWPDDRSDLSGKTITAYVPAEQKEYPSYFPYWVEIQGMVGKAKIRVIDSGKCLESPRKPPPRKLP